MHIQMHAFLAFGSVDMVYLPGQMHRLVIAHAHFSGIDSFLHGNFMPVDIVLSLLTGLAIFAVIPPCYLFRHMVQQINIVGIAIKARAISEKVKVRKV